MPRIPPVQRADLPPNRLGELRKASGLTRREIAHAVKRDPQTLWRWERREAPIPDPCKPILAGLFGVSIDWLMGWEIPAGELPSQEQAA